MGTARTRVILVFALAGGCDSAPREPTPPPATADTAATATARPPQDPKTTLPKPDPLQIAFDPDSRTLTLYALPGKGGQWMLATPAAAKGEPINTIHWFTDEVDADGVSVFYTTADGHPSPRLRLRDVLLAHQQHASRR